MSTSTIFPWMPVHERHSDPLTIEELAKLKIIEHKRGMPMPDDEALRIRTLRESFALDCSKEALIDRYLRILCRVMKKRFLIPCISIVDVDRTWIISDGGPRHLDFLGIDRCESFCAYTVLESTHRVWSVPSASSDERFFRLPWVNNAMSCQFYAAASIVVDGMKLGSIAVVDRVPRLDFDKHDAEMLQHVSDIFSSVLSARRHRYLLLVKERERIQKIVAQAVRNNVHSVILHATELASLLSSLLQDNYHDTDWSDVVERLNSFKYNVKELEIAIHEAIVRLPLDAVGTQGIQHRLVWLHSRRIGV